MFAPDSPNPPTFGNAPLVTEHYPTFRLSFWLCWQTMDRRETGLSSRSHNCDHGPLGQHCPTYPPEEGNRRKSPLGSEGVKELREHLEHVPTRTSRTSGGSPEILSKSWFNSGYPPQVPPWPRGDKSGEQRASARTHEFFHSFRETGVGRYI